MTMQECLIAEPSVCSAPEFSFDPGHIPKVRILFLRETGNYETRSDVICHFRVGQQCLSDEVELRCDCPASHSLVKTLGQYVPLCSSTCCPVREVINSQV